MKKEVAIVMGSDSDLGVMKDAAEILESFGIKYHLSIVSAHRTPDRLFDFAKTAEKKGFKVIIAGAGGSAHLPGMIASLTPLPVIGVPVKGKSFEGFDSLLSIVQMPPGIPVATVAVNGAKNAGILAASIIGVSNKKILKKVSDYKNNLEKEVLRKVQKLEKIGFQKYLDEK
ncbi:MAG: 5-(carboxyamino)imidazole ribonucleotide mutase [Candidatus Levybacteria bacterium]|nr:5-(carboxyamino)imidazole ribonucleotide mutase [Candidatus Levybacteria bacterium]